MVPVGNCQHSPVFLSSPEVSHFPSDFVAKRPFMYQLFFLPEFLCSSKPGTLKPTIFNHHIMEYKPHCAPHICVCAA